MSEEGSDEPIIIRKRRDEEEEAHHGGVWKLAFADFMTAMMAFFLVMWLINSTTKETKAAIVQYFNPVQLVDSSPNVKGLRDPKEAAQGKNNQKTDFPGASKQSAPPNGETSDAAEEQALHSQPLKALDEIARREESDNAPHPSSLGDPFDRTPASASDSLTNDDAAKAKPDTAGKGQHGREEAEITSRLRDALEKIVRAESTAKRGAPQLSVVQNEDGLLISLTDGAAFSMFNVGSIEPKPQMVRILAKIGEALAKEQGEIEIHGHTDARSYKSNAYDNWRLSADRANVANYMLQRGGLPEGRIKLISGHANHQLKSTSDPNADANRRIEILLRRRAR